MKKTLTIVALFLIFYSSTAAPFSDSLRFSLLTVSPGNELYSVFGHTGVRLTDLKNGHDIVFNYGTFDFGTPNFYLKFALGVLDYQLAVELFDDFMYGNSLENRSVIEQELNLTPAQQQKLTLLLTENFKPENRKYRYKFFTDNCSTRPRDVLAIAYNEPNLLREPKVSADKSFRYLFTSYLTSMPWAQFGIELVLGKMTDKIASYDALFLPNNLMFALDKAHLEGKPIVLKKSEILPSHAKPTANSWFTPLIATLIILIMSILVQFSTSIAKWFDRIFFIIAGVLGLFVAILSAASHHAELHYNFVVLFFIPIVILIPFTKNKTRDIVGIISFSIIVMAYLSIPFLPQSFNFAVLILSAALAVRLFFTFAFPKLKSFLNKRKTL